ncbi:MAG: DUF3696 domain-containing protein, partial [Alphaproteobacteria bacterium]
DGDEGDNDEGEHVEIFTTWTMNEKNQQPRLYYLECDTKKHNLKIQAKVNEYTLSLKYKNKEDYFGSKDFEMNKVIAGLMESIEQITEKPEKENKASKRRKKSISSSMLNAFLNIDDISNLKIGKLEDLSDMLARNELFNVMQALSETERYFNFIEQKVGFVNSFRLFPDRTYYQMTKSDYKIGGFGENYMDQLLRWYDNRSKAYKNLLGELRSLDLLNSMAIKKLDGGRFELKVQAKRGGPWASVLDVGFGISQFLPILVSDRQLSKGSTLILAQPEIHLHPNVQAKLSDYFVRQVKNKNKRYIIETHSEYLLNRLRLLIVKGEIAAEDIAVYYFENTKKGTDTYTIEFAKDGQVKNAPKGFFDTYMMDVMDIALNAE